MLAALSALGLTFSLMVGPALGVTFATVTGYQAFSEEANQVEYWEAAFPGSTCTDAGVDSGSTYELPELGAGEAYVAVIVKSGAGEFANTIFAAPPSAGQTVWADTNGNGTFEDGGQDGDQGISHIIVCTGEADESEEASVEESESEEASVEESESAEESASTEGSVLGGNPSTTPSIPDGAMGGEGPSPLPTIVFASILVASLAGLAWVNIQAVRSRS
jgi:hypothetical protein